MPGFFGAFGCDREFVTRLNHEHALLSPTIRPISTVDFAGGIDDVRGAAERRLDDDGIVLIDGEALGAWQRASPGSMPLRGSCHLDLCRTIVGGGAASVAVIDPATRSCTLATDPSGTFPLYVARAGTGHAFSTRLRPLARALRAEQDSFAIAQFTRNGFVVGGRTLYRGIRRLLPGQAIERRLSEGDERVVELSRVWSETLPPDDRRVDEALDLVWASLRDSLDGVGTGRTGIKQ